MAELVVNVVPEVEGLFRLTQEIAKLESKQLQITDPQELTRITERVKELRSQMGDMAQELTKPNLNNYIQALDKMLYDVAKEAELSGVTINKSIGAIIQETGSKDLQESIKKYSEELRKQADEALVAAKNFKGEASELERLETRWAKLNDAATRYAFIVEGMKEGKSSRSILQEAINKNTQEQNTQKDVNKEPKSKIFSAYENAYEDMKDRIDENVEDAQEYLNKLIDITKKAAQKAADAKLAYQSLKNALPEDSGDARLTALEKRMESAAKEAQMTQEQLKGAQNAMRDFGGSESTISPYAQGYEDLANAIKSGSMSEAEKKIEALAKETETAAQKARDAKDAYESLKNALPKGANTQELQNLKNEMDSTKEKAQSLAEQTKGAQSAMRDLGGGKNKLESFGQKLLGGRKSIMAIRQAVNMLPAPIAQAASGFGALTRAALLFAATPIGLVLAAIVGAVKALDYALNTTSGSWDDLTAKQQNAIKGKAMVLGFWESLKTKVGAVGDAIFALTQGDFKSVASSLSEFFTAGQKVQETSAKLAAIMVMEDTLHRERVKWTEKETELNAEVAKSREKISESNDQVVRLREIGKARDAINQKYEKEIEFAKEDLKIHQAKMDATRSEAKDFEQEIALKNKLMQLEGQRAAEQRMLARQEAAARKAIAQERINNFYGDAEFSNKVQKDNNSLNKIKLEKQLIDIRLDAEAQLTALQKKRDQDLLNTDETNAEKRLKIAEQYEREREHIIEFSNAKIAQLQADSDREQQKEIADLSDEVLHSQLDGKQDTLRKNIELINAEKAAQLRALEEEKRNWVEKYGEMTEVAKELFNEKQKLIGQNTEAKKVQLLSEKYQTSENKYKDTKQIFDSDRETLVANGFTDEALELNRRSQEEYKRLGEEYLEQNKNIYKEWLQGVEDMTLEELVTEAKNIQSQLAALEREGKGASEQALALYGRLSKVEKQGANSLTNYQKTAKNISSLYSAAATSIDALTEGASESTKEIVDGMMSIADSGIDMIGNISSLANGTMEATRGTAVTAGEAIKSVERASVILAIIGAALQIVMKLNSLLGGDKERDSYDKAVEKQKEINKMTAAVDDYTRAVREAKLAEKNWFSTSNFTGIRDQWQLAKDAREAYFKKADEQQVQYQDRQAGRTGLGKVTEKLFTNPLQSFASLVDPTYGAYYLTKGTFSGSTAKYNTNTVDAINNLRFETRARQHGTWVRKGHAQETTDLRSWAKEHYKADLINEETGMIDVDMATNILENFEDKLVGETKETLEKLRDEAKAYQEAIENIKNAVSDMYSPLVDDMTNAVWTWLETGEDALSTFEESAGATFANIAKEMIKTMANKLIFSDMSEELETLAKSYAKGEIDEEEMMKKSVDLVDRTMASAEAEIKTIEAVAKSMTDYAEQKGYDIMGEKEQEATFGGYETMSEQTGTELSGRFSAMYIVQSEHLGVAKQIQASILDINKFLPNLRDEMRNVSDDTHEMAELMANGLVELRAINGTTDAIKKLAVRLDERTEVWSKHITNL